MLKALLMKAQKEVRSTVGKTYTVLEKTYIYHHKQNAHRNINVKGAAGEGSEGNKEHVIGNQRKGNLCYIVTGSLAEFCPAVLWKAELSVNIKLEYLADEISKQSVQGILSAYAQTEKKK